MTAASPLRPRCGRAPLPAPLARLRDAVAGWTGAGRARLEVDGDDLAPLAWVGLAPAGVDLAYFAGRDGDEHLGLGAAEVSRPRDASTAPDGWRYVGGMGFDEDPDRARFVAPLVELGRRHGRAYAAAHLVGPSELERRRVLALLDALLTQDLALDGDPGSPRLVARVERPDRAGWDRMMARVLAAIEAGEVGKVVLARQVELRLDAPVDPAAVLARLGRREPRSFRFLLRRGATAFVGASPERLFARSGREVVSEALAGTRRRGLDATEDARIAAALRASDKDAREHAFVADAVTAALAGVCDGVVADPTPGVVATGSLLHLKTRVAGGLRPGVDDADLIAALHPTPAMCGWPTEAARALLRDVEPFSRGPYAAPLGWIGAGGAELAVGIRAVAITGDRALLTAGAGVVRGSDAEAEWRETEAKLAGVLAAVVR